MLIKIPYGKEYTTDKQYSDRLYAYIQLLSTKDIVYEYDINFTNIGEILHITRQTVSTKFKHLLKIHLLKKIEGGYRILEPKQYDIIAITKEEISQMIDGSITLYNYFVKKIPWLPYTYTIIECKSIVGLSLKTANNGSVIAKILNNLTDVGFIQYEDNKLIYVKQPKNLHIRESFILKGEWWDKLQVVEDIEKQKCITLAIMQYGITGIIDTKHQDILKELGIDLNS